MSSPLVAFILGAGPNVGKAVADKLKSQGYAVALGSRSPDVDKVTKQGFYPVSLDVTDSESIRKAFEDVISHLGAPNVVIYNAALFRPSAEKNSPLTLPLADFQQSSAVALGVFTAAQLALPGFLSEEKASVPKRFIVTGNLLPFFPSENLLHFFSLSLQKTIEARLIEMFATAYKAEGIRFYFASLVSKEGGIPSRFDESGPTHAKVYWELIEKEEQGNWDHRFTFDGEKLIGYD